MKKRYKAAKIQPSALVVFCGDVRFSEAFLEFIVEKLGLKLGEFVMLVEPGGPAALAHPKRKSDDFRSIVHKMGFYLDHFKSIRRVVLIGHQDCGYYGTINNHPDKDDKEKRDLPRAAKSVHKFLGKSAETYYASFADESREEILFEKIEQ